MSASFSNSVSTHAAPRSSSFVSNSSNALVAPTTRFSDAAPYSSSFSNISRAQTQEGLAHMAGGLVNSIRADAQVMTVSSSAPSAVASAETTHAATSYNAMFSHWHSMQGCEVKSHTTFSQECDSASVAHSLSRRAGRHFRQQHQTFMVDSYAWFNKFSHARG
ncbi:hypothetical protein [Thiolinea disciformis]|uniref:hypothetical protein n=1 Tax=Thiolinea disciformis TaxID=125614 RepID=UPI0003609FE9|nr:hypothetical protein [Thiolinea disciformis]